MAIAIISTLISSVALAGVAVSLLIQARQLRTSQLQASRAMQAELVRLCIDNPKLISEALGYKNANDYITASIINWSLKSLEVGYSIRTFSAESVRVQAALLFTAKYPRDWWSRVRDVYKAEARTKREREFFAIVERAFDEAGPAPSDATSKG